MRRAKSKPNPMTQTAQIDNLSHDGKGLARIHGKATFVQGALPGEQIEFQYTRIKKILMRGSCLKFLSRLLYGWSRSALIIQCVAAVHYSM